MRLHHALADRQPQPEPHADILGREERLEELRNNFLVHSRAVVATCNKGAVALAPQLHGDLATLGIVQRVQRVPEKVHDHLLQPRLAPEHDERLEQLERALKNIGPINLTAIEECAEIETRYAFLTRQRDDLNAALESLRRAIQRINRASRERFAEAYEAVNDMFMKVFPRLFRGGEARLELVNSEDLLEAGVEIVAQPPGKKLQSVNQRYISSDRDHRLGHHLGRGPVSQFKVNV